MTDQTAAGLPPQADENPTAAPPAPLAATDGPAVQPSPPPARPDQALTAAPAAGDDWGSTPPPTGWSTQGGLDFAAAPVQPIGAPARRRRGLRWLVAAIIVVLVAASASAVFFVVAGAASPSTVARWAPADTIMYVEARFDLPGDQHAKAGQFLAAFPGFADPASLDTKLGELYDKAIRSATGDKVDYSTDIKPWFGGQVALSLSAFPGGGMGTGGADAHTRGSFLFSVTDAAKAAAWLTKAADGKGTAATYGGVALTVFGTGDTASAVGVDDSVLIGGDVATVHAIIDAKGSDGLASTADFKKALANSPKDSVGFAFMQLKKFLDAEMATLPSGSDPFPKEMLDQVPAWVGGSALFDSDSLVFDEVAPFPTGTPAPTNRTSTIATHLPAATVAEFEGHDVGKAIKDAVKLYQATPATKEAVTQVLAALDKAGGLDSYTSWLGDAAVAVTVDGTTVGGGVVVTLQDKAAADAASAKFAALKNLVALVGLPGAKVTSEAHGAATITTIDLGSLKDLQSLAPTMGSGFSDTLPASVADARIALSYTVTDDLAIVGVGGDGFVKAVLDTKAGSSLADQPRYKTAIGRAGASNSSQGYLDVAAIAKAIEAQLPADTVAAYERDTKPYVAPFAAFGYSAQGGDLQHIRFVVTVSK